MPDAAEDPWTPKALPAIASPKGGGALRGLGEKVTIGPTGSVGFTIPLPVSPGRTTAGTPQLALSYDSGSGNGPFGLGWSLSTPSIARKTERTLPRYLDGDESDTFVLAGAEDLVPVLDGSGDRDGHRVDRYRPRVEGGFIRVERWTEHGSGIAHWRTTGADNVVTIFGRNPAARIADPADERRIFRWLIEETRDDRGNRVRYDYKPEDAASIDPARPEERNRSGPYANRYLKRIHHANQGAGENDWHFTMVFDYGEHDALAPTLDEDHPWPVRPDPFSSYRAGFEIRTYRLCRRVLVFHRFDDAPEAVCVRALELVHADDPALSTVTTVVQRGYIRDPDTGLYSTKALPPLELTYTRPSDDPVLELLDETSSENLPAGPMAAGSQWVDLDGEGLSGVVVDHGGAWSYKRNLGDGRFAPLEQIATTPRSGLRSGAQLLDLDGDGRKYLTELGGPLPGHYRRDVDDSAGWTPFVPFRALPVVDWNSKYLRFVDLDGDGRADVLISEDEVWSWYPSLGTDGFGPREVVPVERDEERGPTLVLADPAGTIFLADVSGDGLIDLVRIRNGEICYWPNLGFGRFGAKVTMRDAPVFDAQDQFDPRRLRLADIDGTGTTDVIYLGADAVHWWCNLAGNAWSERATFDRLPRIDQLATVTPVDLLGTGTTCLVWSSPAPRDVGRPAAYLDLMGGHKPYLLATVRANLGVETAIEYAPSTRFYVADREAGRPWATRIPFPVQLVTRLVTTDQISGSQFVSTYSYHHGYYDGVEQELRGFARVDQLDTEVYAPFAGAGLRPLGSSVEQELAVPPVLTRTWYHTGAYLDGERLEARLATEYWTGDSHPQATLLPDTVLPVGGTTAEIIEACRALRGQLLRREVYALDGASDVPYSVSERSYAVRLIQPLAGNRHAVCFAHGRETIDFAYERALDPRVTHKLTLEVDDLGHVRKTVEVTYPRRGPVPFPQQGRLVATCTESDVVHVTDQDWYRIGVPVEARTFEIVPAEPPAASRFDIASIETALASLVEVPFESTATAGTRRLVSRVIQLYARDDQSAALPEGEIESMAIPWHSLRCELTPGLVTALYQDRVTDAMLVDARYVSLDGAWWIPSSRAVLDPAALFQPVQMIDPFGNVASVTYDKYALLCVRADSSDDPDLNNPILAEHSYRTLTPTLVTDANGNRTATRTDELGLVVATAAMGKASGPVEGDSLDDPTTRFEYDLTVVPSFAHVLAREQHAVASSRWQESYEYSDGLGRVAQRKVQAAPDPVTGAARWIGSGRTLFDNKGNPVKQYEPFFSATSDYEDEAALVMTGVTPVIHYDPLGRVIRIDEPDGSLSRVDFDAWSQAAYDRNDTVVDSQWLPDHATAAATASDQRAAALAVLHANTPTVKHVDARGRTFLSIADNGADGQYQTWNVHDVQDHVTEIRDHFDRAVITYGYTITGRRAFQRGMDTGERWTLFDVAGKPARSWDSRGHVRWLEYDRLQRPTHNWLSTDGAPAILVERNVYGELVDQAVDHNLRGTLYRRYDGAGVVSTDEVDFKGNIATASRRLAREYKVTVDWTALAAIANPQAIETAAEPGLESPRYTTTTRFDALNRVTSMVTPDLAEVVPSYDEASLLSRVTLTTHGDTIAAVSSIDYDAKGQRMAIAYDSGARSTYRYDDKTFRLINLVTRRIGDGRVLQDLGYTYDPVGNVVEIVDAAQQTTYFANAVVTPSARYEYDAIYRLRRADGRELLGIAASGPVDWDDGARMRRPSPDDTQAMQTYGERYDYDAVGNILAMVHSANAGSWTRTYAYPSNSNQLGSTDGLPYAHDAHGNTTAMPHLGAMTWNDRDELARVDLGGGGVVYYTYGAGARARKVIERPGGAIEERIYLGGYELYRERTGTTVMRERQTLHVMDDQRRIALVETLVRDAGTELAAPAPVIRYQLGNHLESAVLELARDFSLISYEEYYPFGSTSYQAGPNAAEVSLKRYRYCGKERDDETGLYYFGARYCASWLGRWTAADPAGLVDGVNLYVYARNNPIRHIDPAGTDVEDALDPGKSKTSKDRVTGADKAEIAEAQEIYKELTKKYGIVFDSQSSADMYDKDAAAKYDKLEGFYKQGNASAHKTRTKPWTLRELQTLKQALSRYDDVMLPLGRGAQLEGVKVGRVDARSDWRGVFDDDKTMGEVKDGHITFFDPMYGKDSPGVLHVMVHELAHVFFGQLAAQFEQMTFWNYFPVKTTRDDKWPHAATPDVNEPRASKEAADKLETGSKVWAAARGDAVRTFHKFERPPTDYAYKNPGEDVADSVTQYMLHPSALEQSSPERNKAISREWGRMWRRADDFDPSHTRRRSLQNQP